jgi:outer membrane protein
MATWAAKSMRISLHRAAQQLRDQHVGSTAVVLLLVATLGPLAPSLASAQDAKPIAAVLLGTSVASAQQTASPLTLDAALLYARQHSPRLAATRQSVTTGEAAIATASAERWPRLTLGAAVRGSSQPTETAMGFPLTQLADIPVGQPFGRGHLNADLQATIPVYTGGRIRSAVGLAQAQRDLAQVSMHDFELGLDFEVTSTYANLVQLDRDIKAAQEAVNALTESRRVVARMLDEGKAAHVAVLKVDTRLSDVQDTAI